MNPGKYQHQSQQMRLSRVPSPWNPSWLQTTVASVLPQAKSSQMPPHRLLMQSSTLPSNANSPSARRRSPERHSSEALNTGGYNYVHVCKEVWPLRAHFEMISQIGNQECHYYCIPLPASYSFCTYHLGLTQHMVQDSRTVIASPVGHRARKSDTITHDQF